MSRKEIIIQGLYNKYIGKLCSIHYKRRSPTYTKSVSACMQHLAPVNTAEYHPDEDPTGAEARDHQVQDVIHLLLLGDNGCLTGCRLGLDDDHVGT